MKKVFALAMLVMALLVSACGGGEEKAAVKPTPAEDVATICNALLHFDDAALKKVGLNPEEYQKEFLGGFSKSFIESSGIAFSDEQVAKVNDAVENAFKRATIKTETVSEEGNKATVKVTVDTFEKFTEDLVTAKFPENIAELPETERNDAIINAAIATLQDLKVTGNADLTFECQYNEEAKMWAPVGDDYAAKIAAAIFSI